MKLSLEIVPPRNGIDIEPILKKIERIKDKVDFISVTKGAVGSLRGGTLPLSYFIQTRFNVPVMTHFVTRDYSKLKIENELIDLHHFGIRNILALRGDPPAGVIEEWKGDYKYAYLLVEQIKRMNQGIYLPFKGKERTGFKTNFRVAVAGHPEKGIEYMKFKVDAGADLIITQMVFSFDDFKEYVEKLRENGINIPVIAGVRVLKSLDEIKSTENFFGIKICDKLKENVKDWKNYYRDMILKINDFGSGVHLFCLNDVDVIDELGL